ncbi:MAG TPA: hypothetical protein VHF22_13200, partial [Planctomycetota bacterium]|nr:hypothetical protein [Planctomycetota bacterium]
MNDDGAERAYQAVRKGYGFWDETDARARFWVSGRDRTKYLQNMTSQDVKALAPGETADACALTMKAKLVAAFRIHAAEDGYLLDVEAARAAALLEHLRKYVVVNQVTFEDVTAVTGVLALEGPACPGATDGPQATHVLKMKFGQGVMVLRASISGEEGRRVVAARDAIARTVKENAAEAGGPPLVPPAVIDLLRIENGVPLDGAELSEETFPPETGLEATAISSTKGCYLGQEPIARLHFMGHVNKHLHGLALAPGAPLPPRDAKLFAADGKEV